MRARGIAYDAGFVQHGGNSVWTSIRCGSEES